jgi:hypothetical protein
MSIEHYARRDPYVVALANLILWLASRRYRTMVGGSIRYGLRAAAADAGAVEITAEMIERGAEGLAAERISNGYHDDAEACLRAALGGQ